MCLPKETAATDTPVPAFAAGFDARHRVLHAAAIASGNSSPGGGLAPLRCPLVWIAIASCSGVVILNCSFLNSFASTILAVPVS
jgi:hypothetical protein